MKRPAEEADHCRAACTDELNNPVCKGVYHVVKLSPGRKAIGSIWVFKEKRGSNGDIERYKARLVADGRHQGEGLDYKETFAPTSRCRSLRTIFALVALRGWACLSADIPAEYLERASLHETSGRLRYGDAEGRYSTAVTVVVWPETGPAKLAFKTTTQCHRARIREGQH